MRLFFLSFLLISTFCQAQTGYKLSDYVNDIAVKKIINHSSKSSSLYNLKKRLTVIDFFGTWCVPCIKALPELENLKNNFKDDLSIVLVSIEEEAKLRKFIDKRKPFAFPIVVDVDKKFTTAFQPPSYPYTIVINANENIVFIGNAADLTEELLQKFMNEELRTVQSSDNTSYTQPPVELLSDTNENKMVNKTKNALNTQSSKVPPREGFREAENTLIKLSQDFMYAAKSNEEVTRFVEQLKNISYQSLKDSLKNDDDKKAFWINLYNAYVNSSLHKNAEQYKNRKQFFKAKNILIAGKSFSLDNIEHGILRKSKIKWSLGYLSKLFPNKTEKQLRVNKLDYRIHFALNCGAKSCPPIAFYNSAEINNQLEVATKAYLSGEAEYNKADNVLKLPAILGWFRRDFGGKKKMISLIRKLSIIPNDVQPKIRFKKYDWSLYLDNFKQ
jgi:thiol-disulfide isomerase/thioredoxin